jgi:hypothetical protein
LQPGIPLRLDMSTMKLFLQNHGTKYVKAVTSINTIWPLPKSLWTCKISSGKPLCTPRRQEISCKIQEALSVTPSYEHFVAALQATKDSSAPGPSQLTYGFIKQLPPVIVQEVYQLLCDIWEVRLTPEEWKLKWQQPIPKKVDSGTGVCRVEDIRPLGLVGTFRKLLS